MTHLSDFSFLQRVVSFGYLFTWYLYRVWSLDRFQCLHPGRFRQGELKSIVTLLVLFMMPFQLYYDVASCKIKYEEGFVDVFGHIFTKPESHWTEYDKGLVIPTSYSLCIGFSLQTGTLLLLQCFWNYLANSVAKASFMSSREFMFYIVWTFVSMVIFPVLQYNFSRDIYDPTYKEIMPELAYGIELTIVAVVGVVSHFRFSKLLKNSRDSNNARSITHKIRYFQELNLILTVSLFLSGLTLVMLSADGLTGRKRLNANKFPADFLICNINICSVITWFVVILIFHPKPSQSATNTSMQNPSHDFLSGGKPLESSYPVSPPLMAQNSQASSEYLQYSKTAVAVPMNQPSFSTGDQSLQLNTMPAPPDAAVHNSLASNTPSTATLVNTPHPGSKTKGSEPAEPVVPEHTPTQPQRNTTATLPSLEDQHAQFQYRPSRDTVLNDMPFANSVQSPNTNRSNRDTMSTSGPRQSTRGLSTGQIEPQIAMPTPAQQVVHMTETSYSMRSSFEETHVMQHESTNQVNHTSKDENNHWHLSLDFDPDHDDPNKVRRQKSEDSMWLQQSPRATNPRTT